MFLHVIEIARVRSEDAPASDLAQIVNVLAYFDALIAKLLADEITELDFVLGLYSQRQRVLLRDERV